MKKHTLILIGLVFLLFGKEGRGQNLVPNPSFEDTVSCPAWLSDMSVANWINPTQASPDYFHSCNSANAGIPQNIFGYQNARTGNAYVGGHTSDFSSTDYREYVQCQLISALEAGKYYEVSFYVSRTDSSTKACDNIGAYLSTTAISSSNNQNLSYTPQVISEPNSPITNDTGWVQIIDTIVASGGEQYLTLGIFSNNANTNWVTVSGGWEAEAHYYIDDVSIRKVSSNSINKYGKTYISVFPNPTLGNLNISSTDLVEKCTIYSSLGQLVYTNFPNSKDFQIHLSELPKGIYYINIKTNKTTHREKIIFNR